MKTIQVTLSFGEVELTPEDIKVLKQRIDLEFAQLDETKYKRLKWSTPTEIKDAFESMPDKELLDFARLNDQYREEGYCIDAFSQKIYSELFKRAGLGSKQLRKLSVIQRNYLESKGLRVK